MLEVNIVRCTAFALTRVDQTDADIVDELARSNFGLSQAVLKTKRDDKLHSSGCDEDIRKQAEAGGTVSGEHSRLLLSDCQPDQTAYVCARPTPKLV
jgi:hypothetical protein